MRTTAERHPHDEVLRLLNRGAIGIALLLVTLLVGVQLARGAEDITVPVAAPSTTAYHFSSRPMISGTVVTVNDRQMVVNTDQGEQVTLEMDTRTMAPRDLAPGMVMRAEFLAMEDCRFYAQRVMSIRPGMSTDRLQSYTNTSQSRDANAGSASGLNEYRRDHSASQVSGEAQGSPTPGRMMTATPTTKDHGFSTRPMVSGRVVSVNDHRMVVETDQGQRVGLVMDSRTMVPGVIVPGAVMRAEFTQMKDGRYYAKRISGNGGGMVGREQAYAHTRDSDFVIARDVPDCPSASAGGGNTMTSTIERRGGVENTVFAQSAPVPDVERPETLPQTASSQPLMLLLGLLALGLAGLVTIMRGLLMSDRHSSFARTQPLPRQPLNRHQGARSKKEGTI